MGTMSNTINQDIMNKTYNRLFTDIVTLGGDLAGVWLTIKTTADNSTPAQQSLLKMGEMVKELATQWTETYRLMVQESSNELVGN